MSLLSDIKLTEKYLMDNGYIVPRRDVRDYYHKYIKCCYKENGNSLISCCILYWENLHTVKIGYNADFYIDDEIFSDIQDVIDLTVIEEKCRKFMLDTAFERHKRWLKIRGNIISAKYLTMRQFETLVEFKSF